VELVSSPLSSCETLDCH